MESNNRFDIKFDTKSSSFSTPGPNISFQLNWEEKSKGPKAADVSKFLCYFKVIYDFLSILKMLSVLKIVTQKYFFK